MDILLTHHAVVRYRSRIERRASIPSIYQSLADATLQVKRPAIVKGPIADAYLITKEAVFPVRRLGDGFLMAITCIKKPTIPKADQRAARELSRERHAA